MIRTINLHDKKSRNYTCSRVNIKKIRERPLKTILNLKRAQCNGGKKYTRNEIATAVRGKIKHQNGHVTFTPLQTFQHSTDDIKYYNY